MDITKQLPLVEAILGSYAGIIGTDLPGYRNHVYRVVNLCYSQGSYSPEEQEKIQIAGGFHDIGIWTHSTLDYLPPSESEAEKYLSQTGRATWIADVTQMIEMHHRIKSCADSACKLVEPFRRADIADFSLGLVRMGIPGAYIKALKAEFPNNGFHLRLCQLGSKWLLRHPLRPLPMFRS